MPFRGSNEQKSTSGANFLGFQEVALTDIIDKSTDYPAMDMFLEAYFRNENSQYPWKYSLLGSFDRDADDMVEGSSSLLKRILYFTDALGWNGGVNTKGEWVDNDDKSVDDIAGFLNSEYSEANYGLTQKDEANKYYIFTYKKWNEKAKKAYTTVCPKIVKNTPAGRADLESYVQYMKANKFIVEHDEPNIVAPTTSTGSSVTTSF